MIRVERTESPARPEGVDSLLQAFDERPGLWMGCDVSAEGLYRKASIACAVPALGPHVAPAQAPAPAAAPATPGIPPFQCEPKTVYPGIEKIKSEKDLDDLKAMVKKYQDCVKTYVTERNAASKSHTEVGNAAVREHNAVMKKFVDDQEAAKKAQEEKK